MRCKLLQLLRAYQCHQRRRRAVVQLLLQAVPLLLQALLSVVQLHRLLYRPHRQQLHSMCQLQDRRYSSTRGSTVYRLRRRQVMLHMGRHMEQA